MISHRIEEKNSSEMEKIAETICSNLVQSHETEVKNRIYMMQKTFGETGSHLEGRLAELSDRITSISTSWLTRIEDIHRQIDSRIEPIVSVSEARVERRIVEIILPPKIESIRQELGTELLRTQNQIKDCQSQVSTAANSLLHASTQQTTTPPGLIESLTNRLDTVNRMMTELSSLSLPSTVREMESRVLASEFSCERKTIELLQEMCVEFEADITRLVELIHSVYVQAGLSMPPGTLTSWRKFKEVMFDRQTVGGRKPILGDAIINHISSRSPPGRPSSRSTFSKYSN
jgi:hypothetical protein